MILRFGSIILLILAYSAGIRTSIVTYLPVLSHLGKQRPTTSHTDYHRRHYDVEMERFCFCDDLIAFYNQRVRWKQHSSRYYEEFNLEMGMYVKLLLRL